MTACHVLTWIARGGALAYRELVRVHEAGWQERRLESWTERLEDLTAELKPAAAALLNALRAAKLTAYGALGSSKSTCRSRWWR